MQEYCIQYLKETCFGYLLELPQWGDSNKYPKHMFCEEIRPKQDLSYLSICSLSILYNSKFILMAMSLGTNAVVVTKVHCIWKTTLVTFCLLSCTQSHFWNGVYCKREEFAPKGSKLFSFRVDFFFRTYAEQFWQSCLPWKYVHSS